MTDHLAEYLEALQREDKYRVDAVLKESPHEITQRVFLVGENGAEQGPFIRKFIKRDAQMGKAYELVFEAQRNGFHPRHLPRVIDCYATSEDMVAVTEFIQGETLQDAVRRCGASAGFASDAFPLVCDAVSELHESFAVPIVHRDIKPTNVMLSWDGAKLIDLGIARAYKEGAQADTVHFGTRSYAPPEQFGFGQTSVRSDIYALGMLLCFCLTGEEPTAALRESGFADPRIPSTLRPVIRRATDLDPEKRFVSVAALRQAFLQMAKGPIPAQPAAPVRPDIPAQPAAPAQPSSPAYPAAMPAQPGMPAQPNASAPAQPAAPVASVAPAVSATPFVPASAPEPQTPLRTLRECFERDPRYYRKGIVRNVVLAALWVVFLIACISLTIWPEDSSASYPLWYRGLEYAGYVMPLITFAAWKLIDKRRLKVMFPALAGANPWKEWTIGLVVIFAAALAVYLLGDALGFVS